ncbi:hypothetical protein JCM19000A_40470 [Silvimonas sp. JCM 19000]
MQKKWLAVLSSVAILAGSAATAMADNMPATDVQKESPRKTPSEAREAVRASAKDTLEKLYEKHPSAKDAIAKAAGYAVFNNGSATIVFAGAGGGSGVAVDSTGKETFMKMVQIKGGLGLGIKNSRLVLVFNDNASFKKFITSGWAFEGNATAAAKAENKGAELDGASMIAPSVYAYQFTENGLDAEVTVAGTKYMVDTRLSPHAKKK